MCRAVSHLAQAALFLLLPSALISPPAKELWPLSAQQPAQGSVGSAGSAQLLLDILLDRFPCVHCLRR